MPDSTFRMYWTCPFYRNDKHAYINCEGGRVALPSKAALKAYAAEYCSDPQGWRRCTVARACLRHYEAQEEAEGYGPRLRPRMA